MARWYRAYNGTVTDPKLGEAALIAECSRSVAIAAWHALLEDACETDQDGTFDTTPRRIAVILGEPVAVIEAVFAAFTELGMIEDKSLTAWNKRQFKGDPDPTNAERQRRYKARQRESVTDEGNGVTVGNGVSNAPQIQNQIQKERTPPTPPRGQRQLPEDWEPTEADVKFATGKGYDRKAIAKLGQAFKLHHRAKGNRYSDWHLAFCKWVNNDLDRPGKSRDGPVGLDGKPIERVA